MVPSTGPRGGARCPRGQARLFERLRHALDDDHLVIHDARWVGPSEQEAPLQDGQVDFAIAHPDRGVLLLDVFEGGLSHDPHSDGWRTLRGEGAGAAIADPFRRLDGQADALQQRMQAHPAAVPSKPTVGYGVVLPQVLVPSSGLAAHAPADRVLDMAAMDDLPATLDRLFSHWQRRRPAQGSASPRWWWRIFEDLFIAPRQVRLRLGHRIEEDRAVMASLGPGQVEILDMLARVRRQTIYGPAGTGKTVLAIHKARMLAEAGMRVLLTCYNKALGQHLREAVADLPTVRAQHFHELCYQLADLDARGIKAPQSRQAQRNFYDHALPTHLREAAADLHPRFDALVIDEGQDFQLDWWPALDALCRDPERSIRYIFYDDGQRIVDGSGPVPGQAEAVVLRTNWRNTRRIVAHLAETLPELEPTPCAAAEGVPVRFEPVSPDYSHALRRVLMDLVGREGVRPEDIVVLTGRRASESRALRVPQPVAGCLLSADEQPGAIQVRSIQSFKGLEAPVVILTELDGHPPQRARRLYYVGASRATGHLVVLDDARRWHEPTRGEGR